MTATKVTLLFGASTKDSTGNTQRLAGFSESYYSTLGIDNPTLKLNWNRLANARAALMPANVSIVGSRYQQVDPVGASRQYDNVYPPSSSIQNDLPQVALQWTVRSFTTFNQRSVILRGMPDARVITGEYSPSPTFGAALIQFFTELRTNWQFRAIDRTVLPVKIVQIVAGVLTTVSPHGLVAGDVVNIMSTKVRPEGVVRSYEAGVLTVPTPTTAGLYLAGRGENVPDSDFGRARKALTIYPFFAITDDEVLTPTAITRKVGAPFKKFRGRRTAKR